jgi:hypothetical protein
LFKTTTAAESHNSLQHDERASFYDAISIFRRRAYDVAGCLESVQISFNDEEIKVKSLLDYARLFLSSNGSKSGGVVVDESNDSLTQINDPNAIFHLKSGF